MSHSAVEITLLGRPYSIACPPGQEASLKTVAEELEKRLLALRGRNNNMSREEMAVVAALNIGYELLQEKIQNQNYIKQMDERISLLQSTLEDALVERRYEKEYTAKQEDSCQLVGDDSK